MHVDSNELDEAHAFYGRDIDVDSTNNHYTPPKNRIKS